ncbi:hypothetical protein [Microbacterium sp. P03]|uniref:hypothetical protein n=1 Tax=Microbacterium sp. P03 TaxID=3366946 RepID=UPI0037450602
MIDTPQLSRSDRTGMYLYAVLSLAGIVAVVAWVVSRLVEVASARSIPVLVPFTGETAPLPIGPAGSAVDVSVDRAVIDVADPAPATLFAVWAQPVVVGLTLIALIAIAGLFCLRLARGRAFRRGTARLMYTGAGVVAVGWVLGSILSNMTVNGALAAVSDRSYDGVVFESDLTPVFVILVLTAVATAFQIGERLQRETEGLV